MMTDLAIHVYEPYKSIIGQERVRITMASPATARDVIRNMLMAFPALADALPSLDDGDRFMWEILLLQGSRIMGLDEIVEEAETLHFLPAIVSG